MLSCAGSKNAVNLNNHHKHVCPSCAVCKPWRRPFARASLPHSMGLMAVGHSPFADQQSKIILYTNIYFYSFYFIRYCCTVESNFLLSTATSGVGLCARNRHRHNQRCISKQASWRCLVQKRGWLTQKVFKYSILYGVKQSGSRWTIEEYYFSPSSFLPCPRA